MPHIYLNCMVLVQSAPTPSYTLYSYITVFTKTFTFIVQTSPTPSPILYSLHYILHPHIHLHCPVTVQSAPTPLCSLYNMHPQLHLHCAVTGQFTPTPSPTLDSYRKVWTNNFTITVQLPHSLHQYLHLHQPPIALKPNSIFKKKKHFIKELDVAIIFHMPAWWVMFFCGGCDIYFTLQGHFSQKYTEFNQYW